MSIDPLSDDFLFGKDIADKAKLFKAELERIEADNIDFFKERKSHLQSQQRDSIFKHCMTHTTDGRVTFAFTDTVLPEHVKNDCIEAFKKVYHGSDQMNK